MQVDIIDRTRNRPSIKPLIAYLTRLIGDTEAGFRKDSITAYITARRLLCDKSNELTVKMSSSKQFTNLVESEKNMILFLFAQEVIFSV